MATKHLIIPPFPDNIDRNHFASWLSGFTDGEGHFGLHWGSQTVSRIPQAVAEFVIYLRADDHKIITLIQSYFGIGNIRSNLKTKGPSKPQVSFSASKASHLAKYIVPHFEQYPLLAKKKRDFEIWKKAVDILYRKTKTLKRSKGYNLGHQPHWNQGDLDEFDRLIKAIREVRCYRSDSIEFNGFNSTDRSNSDDQKLLFD